MRQKVIVVVVLLIPLVAVGLCWMQLGGSAGLFSDALDWSTNATPTPASAPAAPGGDPLKAFGLVGPASCRTSEPPTNSPWLPVAHADALKYKLDPIVFDWKIWQESGFNPDAVSSAGAIGIAQFMPDTAQGMGIDPHDPAQSLDASARLDAAHVQQNVSRARTLADHYGGWSARYGYALALAAYNAGPGALNTAWNLAFGATWPSSPWAWLAEMAGETQRYVPNIINCSVS